MVGELILVAGLPGCGKTTYLCQMCREGWLIFDDFKAEAFNDCSQFASSRKLSALLAALQDGLKCLVADIDFCDAGARGDAETVLHKEMPTLKPVWHFFANDPLASEANARSRNRECLQRELALIEGYSSSYCIPHGAVVLPVWRKES